jgi:hypothetical protein
MHCAMKELPIVDDYGDGFCCRMVEWGGMIVSNETFPKGVDATPLFKGLPDDMCQSPIGSYTERPSAHQDRGWRVCVENWRRLLPRTWSRARF